MITATKKDRKKRPFLVKCAIQYKSNKKKQVFSKIQSVNPQIRQIDFVE